MHLRRPALSARTRLYHLEPRGVGSPAVESLTGYLMRLAEAHCVPTSALVAEELLPEMRLRGCGTRPVATWFLDHGPHFNGTSDIAGDAIEALTRLTGRQDLAYLTMRPWAEAFAPYGLVRLGKHARAWCGACYAEAFERGTPLYELLLWSIADVTVCPRHRVPLSESCPYDECAQVFPVIAAHARPGHCSRCQRLLHRHGNGPASASTSGEATGWRLWVAQQIGALLATTPALTAVPTQAAGLAALEAFIHAQCGSGPGAYGLFARTVDIHANLLGRWRKGCSRPTIDLLLRVCYHLDVSLEAFLEGDTRGLNKAACPPVAMARRRQPRRPPAAQDTDRLRQGIEDALSATESPSPSVAETARRLGCTSAVLVRLFPAACRTIADRYQAARARQREERMQRLAADIKRVMTEFDRADIYPAAKRVRARLERRIHPRNSDYNRIRRHLLQEFGWNSDGTRVTPSQPDKSCNHPLH